MEKTTNSKNARGKEAGIHFADSLIEFIHLMYNKNTAIRVLDSLIDRLKERRTEFTEKEEVT